MNLPNKLTIARIILIPVFLVFLVIAPLSNLLGDIATRLVAAAIFGLISLTDMFDGKIARKRNQITDFGKFLDPLADKMLVVSAFLALLVYQPETRPYLVWATVIVVFREFAVTGLRLLVAGKDNIVVAASKLGKLKTVTQITCILTLLLEPVFFGTWSSFFATYRPLSYLTMLAMTVMTLWSGLDYFKSFRSYLDPRK